MEKTAYSTVMFNFTGHRNTPMVFCICWAHIYLGEPQVEGWPLGGDACFAKGAVAHLPNHLAAGIGVYMFIVVWLSAKRSQIHLLWLPLFEIEGRMIFQLP